MEQFHEKILSAAKRGEKSAAARRDGLWQGLSDNEKRESVDSQRFKALTGTLECRRPTTEKHAGEDGRKRYIVDDQLSGL